MMSVAVLYGWAVWYLVGDWLLWRWLQVAVEANIDMKMMTLILQPHRHQH
ncbi:hypothetical protein HmCmsJML240_00712 [Escherichia coli]|nr:hypothetical protein HmCmsJML240_00712 [Escherichia coli]